MVTLVPCTQFFRNLERVLRIGGGYGKVAAPSGVASRVYPGVLSSIARGLISRLLCLEHRSVAISGCFFITESACIPMLRRTSFAQDYRSPVLTEIHTSPSDCVILSRHCNVTQDLLHFGS